MSALLSRVLRRRPHPVARRLQATSARAQLHLLARPTIVPLRRRMAFGGLSAAATFGTTLFTALPTASTTAAPVADLKTSATSATAAVDDAALTVPAVAVGSIAIHGVTFDMDGTLTLPHSIDFARLRKRLGAGPHDEILTLLTTGSEASRAAARAIIEDEERLGAERCQLQPGYHALFAYLRQRGLPHALLTRNSLPNVEWFLTAHKLDTAFDPLLTRDSAHGFKPSPQPIQYIAAAWRLPSPKQLLMVGDSSDDMLSAQRAGALTCLMLDDRNTALVARHKPTFVIRSLDELIPILDTHAPQTTKSAVGATAAAAPVAAQSKL